MHIWKRTLRRLRLIAALTGVRPGVRPKNLSNRQRAISTGTEHAIMMPVLIVIQRNYRIVREAAVSGAMIAGA
jgi:hypothetical protein